MKKKIVCLLMLMALLSSGCGQKEESIVGANGQGSQSIVTEAPTEPESTEKAVPEVTKTPETTATPESTKTPEATATPEATRIPEATATPEATRIPETTATPEATKVPEATAIPEATNEPETTTAPKATAEPENSKEPETTVDATKEPEEPSTQVPTVTEAPVEQHQHTFVEETTPATCTEAEVITTVCSGCGFVSGSRSGQGALGHDLHFEVHPLDVPTCQSAGWGSDVCGRCGYSSGGREVPKLEHDYDVTGMTEGTCRRERTTSYRCKNCGWETVEYGDFNYDNHEEVTSGTYEDYDWEKFEVITYVETSCDRCGTVFSVEEVSREPIIPE